MLPEDTFGSPPRPEAPKQLPFHFAHAYGLSRRDLTPALARWSLVSVVMLGFWLAALGVFVLLPQLPAAAEKSLPVVEPPPKLNLTSVEAQEPEQIAQVQAEVPMVPDIRVEVPPPPPPPIPELSPFDLPLPLPTVNTSPPIPQVDVPVEEEPVVYLVAPARAHHLGDSPMTRTWKLLSASTILVTMFSTPAPAQESEILARLEKMEKSINDSFKNAAKDIADLRLDVTSLQGDAIYQRTEVGKTNLRVEKLESQLGKMQADLEAIRKRLETPALYPPSGGDRFDEIKKQLTSIEQAIRGDGVTQVSKSSPSVGRVMLVNMYPEDLLFIVNQKNIRVLPGQSMPLDNMMSGSLTYEVISPTWGLRARNTTMLNPNETLTLTAR